MASSSASKGGVKTVGWARHLRKWWGRKQNRRVRADGKKIIKKES